MQYVLFPSYSNPFGSSIKSRSFSAGSGYRFGFNTQEKDKEIYNNNETYTATFWEYDGRLGRRWNVDPVVKLWQSNYSVFSNTPLILIDPLGNSDFYNESGDLVGTDGINNGCKFVLTDERDIKLAQDNCYGTGMKGFLNILFSHKLTGTITVDKFQGNVIKLPSLQVYDAINKALENTLRPVPSEPNSVDDPTADKEGGKHEEGGLWGLDENGNEVICESVPGKKTGSNSANDKNVAQIDISKFKNPEKFRSIVKTLGIFHTHPYSVEMDMTFSNGIKSDREIYNEAPTYPDDYDNATILNNNTGYNILGNSRDKSFVIYNSQRVELNLSENSLKKIYKN